MPIKRVLIGSPVHQKPNILTEFLASLDELQTDNLKIDYLFMDDNELEESRLLITNFCNKMPTAKTLQQAKRIDIYQCDEHTHYWKEEQIWKVAKMKDEIISYAKKSKYDYLFLIDSDLVLHPYTLKQLIKTKKDIISNLFWTKWQPNASELPQVWMQDEYTLFSKRRNESLSEAEQQKRISLFLEQLRKPGVYEVGGLGACTLISKTALQAGVQFAEIPNLSYWGEDRHFSVRAKALGFSLFVDTHYPAYHLYRVSDLAGVPSFKRKCRISMGQDAGTTISLCMIVKNEADVLIRCLSSVKDIVDEIIIVDTGSTDKTKEIATEFSAKIYDFKWIDDFSAARNFAFEKATQEYILWLDADDYFKPEDQKSFQALKKTLNPEIDSVTMHYHLSFDANGNVTHSLRRNRLVKRERDFRWIGFVHEYLEVFGNISHRDIAVTHQKEKAYTDRNLQIYRKHQQAGEIFSVRDLYYFANELKDHAFYEEAVGYYQKFLQTKQGWVEDNISACLKMADCYHRLCERDHEHQAILQTFQYDKPRAEACCRLGAFFFNENALDQAIFWYEFATGLEKPSIQMGSFDHAAWSWLPHLQLCLCYDRLGKKEEAIKHNELAFSLHPTHPSILHNKKYFEETGGENG